MKYLNYIKPLFWIALKKMGYDDNVSLDQLRDMIAPFDEYSKCDFCGSEENREVLITQIGNRIVECSECGLWFTSPRINEKTWINFLKSETERSIIFTENRLKYGYSLPSLIKYSLPNWFKRRMKLENNIINECESYLGESIKRLHDVGCGVGFNLMKARELNIDATGNDLNGYACRIMRSKYNLDVYNNVLQKCPIEKESIDVIIMRDYIEHTYHPFIDLLIAHSILRDNGIIWIETFHTDCKKFDKLKEGWNYLNWSHTHHFKSNVLRNIIIDSGFRIVNEEYDYNSILIKIIGRKET